MKQATIRQLHRFLSAAFFWGWTAASAAQEITVSYASLGAAYMDHVVAIEKGYALEEGLNIKILRSGGGSATRLYYQDKFTLARRRDRL